MRMLRPIVMFRFFGIVFRSRADLVLENIALRKQIEILKRQNPKPPIAKGDRILFVWLMKLWLSPPPILASI